MWTRLLLQQCRRLNALSLCERLPKHKVPQRPIGVAVRLLSTTGGDGGDDHDKKQSADDDDSDVFGVHFDDGADQIGPTPPPQYKRDETTGRFTGEVVSEITEEDKRILSLKESERQALIQSRLQEKWKEDKSGGDTLNQMGRKVREAEMGMGVLGRSTQAQAYQGAEEEDADKKDRAAAFSKRLTPAEFASFRAYMRKKHDQKISADDIPVSQEPGLSSAKQHSFKPVPNDEAALATKWMSSQAKRQMDEALNDDPLADLMPADLNTQRLVSRKQAKLIPRELLHHNNVALLKYFTTPTGQIKHRIQSRLGAKDQRKVSRLIKRARQMGLMPYQHQFIVEQHGWIHAPDLHEKRDWEDLLERRGLVVKPPPPPGSEEEEEESAASEDTPASSNASTSSNAVPE